MGETSEPRAGRFFAEFAVRMVAFWIDLMLVAFLSQVIKDHALVPVGLSLDGIGAVIPFVAFLYFTASWVSPLRATPVQWLFGMRIVDKSGETLTPVRATLRSLALLGLFFAAFTVLGALADPVFVLLAIAAYAALFLAAVTPDRQAAHDLLAQSIVVNKGSLKSIDSLGTLPRPAIWKMVGDGLILAVPVFMLLSVAQMQNDRDMVYRTIYAVEQVSYLKIALEESYDSYGRWPTSETELGAAVRGDYPDGGYFELEDDGVIRISFEVKPELVTGNILISPSVGDDGITWECSQEGGIRQNHLPSACRDQVRDKR